MKKKQFLALILSMVMVLTMLSGCAQKPQTPTDPGTPSVTEPSVTPPSTEGATLHFGLGDEPPGIDPSISSGTTQGTIYASLYEGLTTCTAEGKTIPAAAESWTISEDKTEYIFKLRDNLKWSDGQPVTAKDFVYAWLRVINPETASTYSYFVESFLKNATAFAKGEVKAEEVGVQAVDDLTLKVTLGKPAAHFLQVLFLGCWMPVRQDMVEANPEKWCFEAETCVTNGPFKFTEYKIGSYITAVKNEHYWDADSVQIENLKFSFIKDGSTALAAFQAGDVDGIASVPNTEFVKLLATDDRLHTFERLVFQFLRLNTKTKGLDNVKVRRAISLAFDRKGFLDGLGNITSQPALGVAPGGLIVDGKDFREASGNNGFATTAKVEEARALLAEAGYPNGEGLDTFRLHCAQNNVKAAEIVQQMLLTNLGIKTKIGPVDDKLFFPMTVEGKYDIAFGGCAGDYASPMTFLEIFKSTTYDNCTGWANPEYDDLYTKASFATDEATALDFMIQAERLLCEESPMVPLYFPEGSMMMSEKVTNWFISNVNVLFVSRAKIK